MGEEKKTATTAIEHIRVATGMSYDALVAAFERELGHFDATAGVALVQRKASWNEVKREIDAMAGPHGLMVIFRADQGAITSLSDEPKRCSLYLVGNPVIANEIISLDLRASFYVPFPRLPL